MENQSTKVRLLINGMHCAGCTNSVKKALLELPEVTEVNVQLTTETAEIYYKGDEFPMDKIREAVKKAGYEVDEKKKESVTIEIGGMHCTGCSSAVEKALNRNQGVLSANVNLTAEKAFIEFDPSQTDIESISGNIEGAGYEVIRKKKDDDKLKEKRKREEEKLEAAKDKMIKSWVVTAPLMIWMFVDMILGIHITSHLVMEIAMVAGAGYVLFVPGRQTLMSAVTSSKNLTPNMDVLIALGTLASLVTGFMALGYILEFYDSQFYSFAGIAAMIMAFHLTGRYIETKARGRASEAITKLLTLEAQTARIIKNGKEQEIEVADLKAGDIMIVRPGEKIPSDGEVVDGKGTVDESMVTGESIPVVRKNGDTVIGGTINSEGTLRVKATEVGENTFLNRVISMVEEAQGSKIPIQEFADRITVVFVPVILALSGVTFLAWILFPEELRPLLIWADSFIPWIITDLEPVSQAFFVTLAVLVIACPCALGLATPTALMVGTGIGAENGILIRKGEAIQRLDEVTTFVFDKTGTLTKGKPEVVNWIPFNEDEGLKKKISAVENLSEHPLSRAITSFAGIENLPEVKDFESFTGMGVKGVVNGEIILAGNSELLEKFSVEISSEVNKQADKLLNEAITTIYLVVDNSVKAICGIKDTIKEETPGVIEQIHKMGYKTSMLTGDQQKVAELIAGEIGIEKIYARVKPDEKSNIIAKLQEEGEVVAMVGDGINDAPALTQANVGIALGTGTDIAIESAGIILVDGNPEAILRALKLSRETFKKIRQNLFWAFFYNVIMIPAAMIGWMHPVLAEIAMAVSSINVVGNSRRLQGKKIR